MVVVPNDGRFFPDGSINGIKRMLRRVAPGILTSEGDKPDVQSDPLVAHIQDGYGPAGMKVVGLTFSTAGCWEITGRPGDHPLTFVTYVIPPSASVAATPEH